LVITTPRGIRNNNPGNIRKSGQAWQGLAKEQPDASFFSFSEPVYGIRAMAKILMTYHRTYGLNTVRGIIGRWAPPVENNTGAYVASVAKALKVTQDTRINVFTAAVMLPLLKAIIQHENGTQPYDDTLLGNAIAMAGIKA
jgi:hypothetical protein